MEFNTIKLEKNLKAFTNILLDLNKDNNLVLGGSYALMLHGMEIKRIPEDVDIIIYNPTNNQIKLLEKLGDFNNIDDLQFDYPQNVYKFKTIRNKVEYTLDILIETKELPKNLLSFERDLIKVSVQSISNIIEAKAKYSRIKDLRDLITFKNINFNIIS